MMKNKKGFTLIELLLALGLLGIVSTVIFSIFISNINNFERNQKRIEVQQNMRTAVEFISRESMSSKGIEAIKDKIKDKEIKPEQFINYKDKEVEIKYITLSTVLEKDKYNRKTFKVEDGKLKYGHLTKNSSNNYTNMEVSWYIDKITITPIFNDLNKLTGIIFTIHTDEKYNIKPITTSIYFRNVGVQDEK